MCPASPKRNRFLGNLGERDWPRCTILAEFFFLLRTSHLRHGKAEMPTKQKVLIVDHNPDLLIVLEKFLEDSGYETTITWNGREALSWLDSQAFAAVIIGLKSVPCLEIVRRLQQKKEDTVCIVLDGPQSKADSDELRAMAVQAVISKWNLKEVIETIQATTGNRIQPKGSASAA